MLLSKNQMEECKKYYLLSWFMNSSRDREKLICEVSQNRVSREIKIQYKKLKPRILEYIEQLKLEGIDIITWDEDAFPKRLKELNVPEPVLLCKGDKSLLNAKKNLGAVGSRASDPRAEEWIEREFEELSWTLVSGGARGIDICCHRVCFRRESPHIIVIPSGILKPYPSSLRKWYSQDLYRKKTLMLSQFSPYQGVLKHNFHRRNTLLAALSDTLLVVQAQLRSGSMMTAGLALDFGREIITIPASPWDQRYGGNLKLLNDGATYTTDLSLFQ